MSNDIIVVGRLSGNSNLPTLNFKTVQKMIGRFLTCNRIKTALDEGKIMNHVTCSGKPEIKLKAYTKEELAKKLGINQEKLEKLKLPSFYKEMANRISLPLVQLYCATKFDQN